MTTEFVTHQVFDSYARRLAKKSTQHVNDIIRAAYPHIIVIQDDKKGMIVRPGWREAMRQRAAKGDHNAM